MPFLHCHERKEHYNSSKYKNIPLKNGYQVKVMKNDLVYEGFWKNSQREGSGILTRRRSDKFNVLKYQGSWNEDTKRGEGNGFIPKEGYYKGDWKCGVRHGWGIQWYCNGSIYAGNWLYGKRHGFGVEVQTDGNRYEGEWFNDMRQGHGMLLFLDTGQAQIGVWWEGEAKSTTMEDIPFRQTASHPTSFPIPSHNLQNIEEVLISCCYYCNKVKRTKFIKQL